MKKYIYITDPRCFGDSSFSFSDVELEAVYPAYGDLTYDLKLVVTTPPMAEEKRAPFYNNYREVYGHADIAVLGAATANNSCKNILLNGFRQEHLDYIAPYIRDKVEVLYLFKCPKIKDLSALAEMKHLKCLRIFWNTSLETLWDMRKNEALKIISFHMVSKLNNIEPLIDSKVEYVCLDSMDNNGNMKPMLFDRAVLEKAPTIQHLILRYKKSNN